MAAATNSTLGTVALAGDLAGTADAPELAPTGVKAGTHQNAAKIHVDSKGRIQWCGGAHYEQDIAPSIANASDSVPGVFRVGPNININAGIISVNQTASNVKGIFKLGNNLEINQSTGAVDVILPDASASQRGIFQVGSGFAIDAGVLLREGANRDASAVVKGISKIGENFAIDFGTLSIPYATDSVAGVASVDTSNFYLDNASHTLYPHAAHTQLFGMVYGWSSDFALDVDGKLTFTSPYASTVSSASTLGMVKIGAGLFMNGDDALTAVKDASPVDKGLVEVSTGFSVASGILSADLGSSSTWGLICVGDNTLYTSMSYNLSNINSPGFPEHGTNGFRYRRCDTQPANLAFGGVVRSADMNNISINNGVMDVGVNIPRKDTQNTFTKAQVISKQSFIDTDWSRGNVVELVLTSNITSVPAPINAAAGQVLNLICKQDATGNRTVTGWDSVYKFNGTLTLSTAANAVDVITVICKSSTEFYVLSSLGYQ